MSWKLVFWLTNPAKIIYRNSHWVELLVYQHKDHWDKLLAPSKYPSHCLVLTVTFNTSSPWEGSRAVLFPRRTPDWPVRQDWSDPGPAPCEAVRVLSPSFSQAIFVARLHAAPIHCGYDLLLNLGYLPWFIGAYTFWSVCSLLWFAVFQPEEWGS